MKLLVLGLFLAIAACTSNPAETSLSYADCLETQVIRIIDGDTLDTSTGWVRLFGVDTPERGQRCATEATEHLRELAGDVVRLENGSKKNSSITSITRMRWLRNTMGKWWSSRTGLFWVPTMTS